MRHWGVEQTRRGSSLPIGSAFTHRPANALLYLLFFYLRLFPSLYFLSVHNIISSSVFLFIIHTFLAFSLLVTHFFSFNFFPFSSLIFIFPFSAVLSPVTASLSLQLSSFRASLFLRDSLSFVQIRSSASSSYSLISSSSLLIPPLSFLFFGPSSLSSIFTFFFLLFSSSTYTLISSCNLSLS